MALLFLRASWLRLNTETFNRSVSWSRSLLRIASRRQAGSESRGSDSSVIRITAKPGRSAPTKGRGRKLEYLSMARSKSSGQWLQEHVNDPYVKQAQRDGYRSRSSYKLLQLNEKDRLIRPGMLIVDLGCAPGGWSQVATRLAGERGRVIATDILPMDPLQNVDFIQGDFTEETVLHRVLETLGGQQPQVVICDIAP